MKSKHAELIKRLHGFIHTPREAQTLCLEAANALQAESAAMPEDFLSHKFAWLSALVIARDAAKVSLPDMDDKDYWEHEIRVFQRAYAELEATTLQPPAPVSAKPLTDEHVPAVYQLALCEIQRLVKENFGRMPQGVWPGKVLGVRDAIEAAHNITREQP